MDRNGVVNICRRRPGHSLNQNRMSRRPLPNPPGAYPEYWGSPVSSDMYYRNQPSYNPYAYPSHHVPPPPDLYGQTTSSSIPVGTLLHKGFYDLLAMIPTPSPSRLIWGDPQAPPAAKLDADPALAGPRYEEIPPTHNAAVKAMPRKGRRVSKDMVSKPTGFVYVATICFKGTFH
jgi:protein-serine/threonine kinase